jgi:hypothetical protein
MNLIKIAKGAVASVALVASTVWAQESSTTTTTTTTRSTGTITEYSPGKTFTVKETGGPVSYRYGERVIYRYKDEDLDDDGIKARIRVGVPVNIDYTTRGEDRILNRVEIDD